MKVRITYRSECMIEADTLAEAKSIWESAAVVPKDTKNASFEFVETVSVEDGDTFENIEDEFENVNELCGGLEYDEDEWMDIEH